MSKSRTVTRVILSTEASDGAGVKLRRSIGTGQISELDPFLLLDNFGTENPDDYIAGFPSHPHRGTRILRARKEFLDPAVSSG